MKKHLITAFALAILLIMLCAPAVSAMDTVPDLPYRSYAYNASMSIQTDKIANNSVQQREQYNNVSIDHENGFISINIAGTTRVIMNGTNGFAVQRKSGSTWVNVNSLEEFGLLVNRLTSYAAKDKFYIEVGEVSGGKYGLLFKTNNQRGMSIYTTEGAENSVTLETNRIMELKADSFRFKKTNGSEYGATGFINPVNITKITVNHGLITDWS